MFRSDRVKIPTIKNWLETGKWEKIQNYLEEMQPVDIAQLFPYLSHAQQLQILTLLSAETSANTITYLDMRLQAEVFSVLPEAKSREILAEMSPDDITDLLGDLPAKRRESILRLVHKQDMSNVKHLLSYPQNTAGGLMTTEFVAIKNHFTAGEAMSLLRQVANDTEVIYYIYVLDQKDSLVGVLSLRELVLAPPATPILELMDDTVIAVPVSMIQEEVAGYLKKYDFSALPVVDANDKMLGVVTADDIMDVLEEEATEDISRFAAITGKTRSLDDLNVGALSAAGKRIPWLVSLLFVGIMAGSIVNHFQSTLQAAVALTVFMPMIAGMAGNTGTQALAVVVRRLALGEFSRSDAFKLLRREMGVGLIVGLTNGIFVSVLASFWKHNVVLGFVVGFSLSLTLIIATLAGATVPILLHRLKVDPAIASGPFITTMNDLIGLGIYFSVARKFMQYLV